MTDEPIDLQRTELLGPRPLALVLAATPVRGHGTQHQGLGRPGPGATSISPPSTESATWFAAGTSRHPWIQRAALRGNRR